MSALIRSRSCNDATAACAAEFFFGRGWRYRDFLYFFVGEFLGGGLGARRRAAAGTHRQRRRARLDAGHAESGGGVARQLIACASIYQLERRLERAGIDASSIWATPDAWADFGPHLDDWIEDVAVGAGLCFARGDFRHRFRGDRDRRRDAGGVRDRLTARTARDFRRPRPARPERRRDRARNGRRRRARDRRRRAAAHQEFRPGPRGSAEGRHGQAS